MTTTKRSGTKQILQTLVRGVDPAIGQELAHDTVVQRVHVIRVAHRHCGLSRTPRAHYRKSAHHQRFVHAAAQECSPPSPVP